MSQRRLVSLFSVSHLFLCSPFGLYYTEPGRYHLTGRCCKFIGSGSYLPAANRDCDLLAGWHGKIQLDFVEGSVYFVIRRAGIRFRNLHESAAFDVPRGKC